MNYSLDYYLHRALQETKEFNDCYFKHLCWLCTKRCEYREVEKVIKKLEKWRKII